METETEAPPRRLWPVGVVLAVIALVVAGGAAFYFFGPRWATSNVAVPPDNATSTEVVKAYLRALDVGDCDTAEALLVPDRRNDASNWCSEVASLTVVEIGEPYPDDPGVRGRSGTPDAVVENVPTTIVVKWRPLHADSGFGDGPTSWGYSLVQEQSGAWRIFDQGVG